MTSSDSQWKTVCAQAYNPINYLRNVAINNSRTPYTFYVDVDLVPSTGLYDSLCRRLAELNDSNRRNVVIYKPVISVKALFSLIRINFCHEA